MQSIAMQSESEQDIYSCKERNSFQEARKKNLGKTKDAYFYDLGRQCIRVRSKFEFRISPSNLSITFTTDQKIHFYFFPTSYQNFGHIFRNIQAISLV